jgi:aldehyde dehydrogenase (NAD+)
MIGYLAELSVGHGLTDPDMGPLISATHLERVDMMVEGARREGAEVIVGGGRVRADTGGNFYAPTLLTGVTNDMDIAQHEVFGPVQCVIAFDDVDEAVSLANDSRYGLSAGVFTTDIGKAHRIAARLQAGQVLINRYPIADVSIPFGGYKESGLHREKGLEALLGYTQTKAVIVSLDDA